MSALYQVEVFLADNLLQTIENVPIGENFSYLINVNLPPLKEGYSFKYVDANSLEKHFYPCGDMSLWQDDQEGGKVWFTLNGKKLFEVKGPKIELCFSTESKQISDLHFVNGFRASFAMPRVSRRSDQI